MRRFRDRPIRHKLAAMTMSVSLAALLIVSTAYLVSEYITKRKALLGELATLAEIIGHNSSAALLFGDAPAAESILASLRAKPDIVMAAIFTTDGTPLAVYPAGRQATMPVEGTLDVPVEAAGETMLLKAIHWDDGVVGYIYLIANLQTLYAQIWLHVTVASLVLALSLATAMLLSAGLQRQVSGPILRLVEAMRHVSKRKDYSVRIEKAGNDELGTLVDGFHDMLAEIQTRERGLSEARRDAELANRAKTAFLANMSHELRTPLNAIIGFSDMMKQELFGPMQVRQYREYADDIHDSGTHLLGIINTILDLSKVEAGKVELQEVAIDVPGLVERALRLFRERASNCGVTIARGSEGDLPLLLADERMLRQCLGNLLSNALKFTPTGGRILVSAVIAGDGRMAITVTDTGIGIAKGDIPTALEPFGQVDSSLARKYEGTGLGLPIVKSFVELHGGTIAINSELGTGTSVTMAFPASRIRPNEAASPESALTRFGT